MGQQQILLIVLGAIIVGIAIVVGINMFTATAAQANLDAVINDLVTFGARAQQYYVKPVSMGGGGNSFNTITMKDISTKSINENGKYSIKTKRKKKVVLRGIGVFDGDDDGRNVRLLLHVFADSLAIKIKRR